MFIGIHKHLRRIAECVLSYDGYSGDSPYVNIPIYQQQTELEPDSREIGMGPPSMYDEPDSCGRLKNKNDMRRQGPQPLPTDPLHRDTEYPVTITSPVGEPREGPTGEPWNSTTMPRGSEDGNRETWAPDEGDLTLTDVGGDVVFNG